MKRLILIGLLMVMASSTLAQTPSTSQPSEQTSERVTVTLKAASAEESPSNMEQQAEAVPRQPSRESKRMPCERLRAEIDRKIRANGVPRFSLEVIPTAQAETLMAEGMSDHDTGEIVGSCGGGNYKILYRRG